MKGGQKMVQTNVEKVTEALAGSGGKITMFADGFVDEVWEIINERMSNTDYALYTKMEQFARRITSSGGVGLELVRKRRVFGGFTPNTGYTTARLGVDTTVIGVYGKNKLDPVFSEVDKICNVYSIGDAAVTHVFEFNDGKILMSHMEAVQDISWQSILDVVDIDKVRELLTQSDIIGVGYWSLLPAFDEIVEQICANMPSDGKLRRFFFDFADFRKKDVASLNRTLKMLSELNDRFPMMLSVNEHEAAALFALHNETLDDTGRPIAEKAEHIRARIGFSEFIIHSPKYAVAASSREAPAFVASAFCEKPMRNAGAGDAFNGGYLSASLAGLNTTERLQAANAVVGHFLRTAVFPDIGQVARFLDN